MRPANPLRVRSLKAALDQFLSAPATGGYPTNENVVLEVMGARGKGAWDCPTFDNVRLTYSVPKACTFERAFYACWRGPKRNPRDWRDFDLETLQESHEEFRHLQLPERVQDALLREEEADYYDRTTTRPSRTGYGVPTPF